MTPLATTLHDPDRAMGYSSRDIRRALTLFVCSLTLACLLGSSALFAADKPPANTTGSPTKDAADPEWQPPEVPRERLLLPTEPKPSSEQQPPSPRELLELYQIPTARLDGMQDGEPLLKAGTETDLLLRVMYRYPEIPLTLLEDWADDNAPGGAFDWSLLATEPAEHRGKVFPLKGRVVEIKKVSPDDAAAKRYQIDKFYRVRLELNGSRRIVDIFTHHIPKDWQQGTMADMQAGATAMFLKRGDSRDPANPLLFVADRMAWYQDSLLGDLGVDHSLFDQVVSGRGIVGKDRELFYQMLYAVGVAHSNELVRYAEREIVVEGRKLLDEQRELKRQIAELNAQLIAASENDKADLSRRLAEYTDEEGMLRLRIDRAKLGEHELVPLLEHPRNHEGELMLFRGTARRITKVLVRDKDIIERFGIDHYYQIDAIVELEVKVKLPSPIEGEPPRERWSYPITFCARQLPAGLPTGDNIQEEVRLAGFFFKNWAYQLDNKPGKEKEEKFIAPMLIGREPIWLRPETAGKNPYNGVIAGVLFIVALLGVWIGVWRLSRGDKQFQLDKLKRTYDMSEGVSLNEMDLEDSGLPNFSHLNESPPIEAELNEPTTSEEPQRLDSEAEPTSLKTDG